MIPQSKLYRFIVSKTKPISAFLYKHNVCSCKGNAYCLICWGAMEDAFDKKYASLKAEGMEDYLEAKEFMWDFFEKRDKRKSLKSNVRR